MIVDNGPITSYLDVLEGLIIKGEEEAAEVVKETWREQAPNSPHKDTRTVYLKMCEISEEAVFNSVESLVRPILVDSPMVQEVILDCMSEVGACVLGRVMLVNLKAGGIITEHKDEGEYAAMFRRYHLPLITNPNCHFYSQGEGYVLKAGNLYELENKKEHSVLNYGDTARVHLIMDMQLISEL